MEISLSHSGGRARVELKGHVDEKGAETIKEQLRQIDYSNLREMVFDFREVNRIGSAGIGQMLLVYKTLSVGGAKMRVENLSFSLLELFQGLKLDTLFQVQGTD
ncbi:MAG: STAS domain-containing protein [Pseudomonadota bacterium]